MWWRPALGSILILTGCEQEPLRCTLADCDDGYIVTLGEPLGAEPGTALPAGRYQIEVYHDDTRLLCSYELPDGSGGGCSGEGITVYPLARGIPGATIQGFGLSSNQTPRELTLIVRHEGGVLLEERLQLEYQRFAPNGEECAPICLRAGHQLELPF